MKPRARRVPMRYFVADAEAAGKWLQANVRAGRRRTAEGLTRREAGAGLIGLTS